VAAAHGLLRFWDAGGGRRVAAAALFAVQAGLAIREVVEAVLFRYRP
jgi:preprotein translocase subunit Sec61beta